MIRNLRQQLSLCISLSKRSKSNCSLQKKMLNEVSRLSNGMSSYDTNVMLAALISLLLVILFVLLLHIYTKWFLSQAHQRRQSSSVSHVLRPSRFHDFHTLHFDDTTASNSTSKGLDASVIASIPLFVYKTNNIELEYCVICLSAFEEEEIGRDLPKCGHGFHVECIDMWLHSHTNCPICRASVVVNDDFKVETGDAVTEDSNTETVLVDFSSVDSETIGNVMENNDSSTSSMSSLGNSLKSMLSRNSSEHKVYVSNVE